MLMLPLGEPIYDEAGLWWPWWCECSAATAPKVPFLLMLLILGRLEKRFVSSIENIAKPCKFCALRMYVFHIGLKWEQNMD